MTTDTDELRALRAFRAEDAACGADASAAARAALLERIEAAAAPTSVPRVEAPRARRPRRRLLAGGLGFAVSAAAAAALVVGVGTRSVRPEAASAAKALRTAAGVAAGGPDVPLGAGRYWYVSRELVLSSRRFTVATPAGGLATYALANVRERSEEWIDSEGEGRRVTRTIGTPRFASPADRRAWVAAGRPALGQGTPWTLAPAGAAVERQPANGWKALSGLSYDALRALSTDDDALAHRLRRVAADSPEETFAFAANLLRSTPVSAAQRAALYRVLAKVPGVELLGTVKDERGRSGTGIALERDGVRMDLLFDPETALLLDFSRTVTDPRQVAGRPDANLPVQEHEAFLSAGVVDSTHARP
jgi:hypothetical protein